MSRIEPVIYLDLDGVCTDYVGAGIRALGRQPDEVLAYWRAEMPVTGFRERVYFQRWKRALPREWYFV